MIFQYLRGLLAKKKRFYTLQFDIDDCTSNFQFNLLTLFSRVKTITLRQLPHTNNVIQKQGFNPQELSFKTRALNQFGMKHGLLTQQLQSDNGLEQFLYT